MRNWTERPAPPPAAWVELLARETLHGSPAPFSPSWRRSARIGRGMSASRARPWEKVGLPRSKRLRPKLAPFGSSSSGSRSGGVVRERLLAARKTCVDRGSFPRARTSQAPPIIGSDARNPVEGTWTLLSIFSSSRSPSPHRSS